tara:strand:+ start:174 stop:380 length:207 start_codon:yes stop_codon:yes gene_type:complete
MKKIIILALIIVIVICFYSIRNIYENFDYKKINIKNENLLQILANINNNLNDLNDRIINLELKLNEIY